MNEDIRALTREADSLGFKIIAVTFTERGEGLLAGGLVTVERDQYPHEGRQFATLRWAVEDDGEVYLHTGHYDLDRRGALADFEGRAGWAARAA